jgi:hypothetical protein
MTIYGSNGGEVIIPNEIDTLWEEMGLEKYKEGWLDKKFPHGIAGWRAKYALLHPWVILDEWKSQIKWAWQRVFRKWDDRVVWSIDYYVATMVPQWLEMLKKKRHGIPCVMLKEEDYLDENCNVSDETMKQRGDEFDAILDEIIEGFKAYNDMSDVYDKEKLEQYKQKFDKGMELFVEYFETLWD